MGLERSSPERNIWILWTSIALDWPSAMDPIVSPPSHVVPWFLCWSHLQSLIAPDLGSPTAHLHPSSICCSLGTASFGKWSLSWSPFAPGLVSFLHVPMEHALGASILPSMNHILIPVLYYLHCILVACFFVLPTRLWAAWGQIFYLIHFHSPRPGTWWTFHKCVLK